MPDGDQPSLFPYRLKRVRILILRRQPGYFQAVFLFKHQPQKTTNEYVEFVDYQARKVTQIGADQRLFSL